MLDISFTWKPDSDTLMQMMQVAVDRHLTLEHILEEAIAQYLDGQIGQPLPIEDDPIMQIMYDGSPNLGEREEEILEAELGVTSHRYE